ncbi:MAG: hypothetical protein N2Z68_00275 [Patescibacteria group bacterium]|nr:hypothetical protein [Patescibacteria group bacterium]
MVGYRYTVHIQFVPPRMIIQKIRATDAAELKRLLSKRGIISEIVRFSSKSWVHLRVQLPVHITDEGWETYAMIVKTSESNSGFTLEFPSLKNSLAFLLERAYRSIGVNVVTEKVSELKKSLRIVLEE